MELRRNIIRKVMFLESMLVLSTTLEIKFVASVLPEPDGLTLSRFAARCSARALNDPGRLV